MRYPTAAAFRRALEDRLKSLAENDPARLARYRKRVVFDRLLARLVTAAPTAWVLKGGFALDLRLADRARTTKDVDLAWRAEEHDLLDALLDAAGRDLDDYFVFRLERADTAPDLLGGAHRFRVTASLAGRPFEAFVLDVGTHEGPFASQDLLTTPDLLGFAGIPRVTVPTLTLAAQVAEKVDDYAALLAVIARLPHVCLAVDDTGAGYSSLSHVLRLEPAFVKLDRTLVAGLELDRARRVAVRGLAALALELGAEVIAEGVERQAEADALGELGITLVQGWLTGRPERLAPIDEPAA